MIYTSIRLSDKHPLLPGETLYRHQGQPYIVALTKGRRLEVRHGDYVSANMVLPARWVHNHPHMWIGVIEPFTRNPSSSST